MKFPKICEFANFRRQLIVGVLFGLLVSYYVHWMYPSIDFKIILLVISSIVGVLAFRIGIHKKKERLIKRDNTQIPNSSMEEALEDILGCLGFTSYSEESEFKND